MNPKTQHMTQAEKQAEKNELKDTTQSFFSSVYETHKESLENIPWADLKPNEHLIEHLHCTVGHRGRAIVIGCGLGDDAKALEDAGYEVTAFDIAPQAIKLAKQRFIDSTISFEVGDIFKLDPQWLGAFDFVFEAFTIQSLPLLLRDEVITNIASLLKPKGKLLTIAYGRNEDEPYQGRPWPLTINEVKLFTMKECKELDFSIMGSDRPMASLKFKALFEKA